MAYWGNEPTDCDYAFDAVGVYILLVKQRMFADADNVISKSYPEQGIVASLACLRIIGEHHRKNLFVHFGKRDFERAKALFYEWYDLAKSKLPKARCEGILEAAEQEFILFQNSILDRESD